MSGPDMINSLLGILLRFRKDEVAMAAAIEQMFYRFRVDKDHVITCLSFGIEKTTQMTS